MPSTVNVPFLMARQTGASSTLQGVADVQAAKVSALTTSSLISAVTTIYCSLTLQQLQSACWSLTTLQSVANEQSACQPVHSTVPCGTTGGSRAQAIEPQVKTAAMDTKAKIWSLLFFIVSSFRIVALYLPTPCQKGRLNGYIERLRDAGLDMKQLCHKSPLYFLPRMSSAIRLSR